MTEAPVPANPFHGPAWAKRLAAVLLLLALVRILPVTLVEHVSPDSTEFLSITRNLAETGRPLLSIKAYYYHDTPIVHYGGYERPILPAVVFGIGALGGGSLIKGAQWVVFTASLLTVLCLILFLRHAYGLRAAMATGLLVGLAPPFLIASFYPWSEMLSLFAIVWGLMILGEGHRAPPPRMWQCPFSGLSENPGAGAGESAPGLGGPPFETFPAGSESAPVDDRQTRRQSRHLRFPWESAVTELTVGLAIGIAGAMRAINLVMVVPVAWYLFATRRSWAGRLRALALLLVGPAGFLAANTWVNICSGAPALLLPQGFLYGVEVFTDGMEHWDLRHLPPSLAAFLAQHYPVVVRRIAKQSLAYLTTLLFRPEWLFVWWAAFPLVWVRLRDRALHPLSAVALGTAALHFLVYAVSWSTFCPDRFLLVPFVLVLGVCVGEAYRAWGATPLLLGPGRAVALPVLLVAGTLIAYGGIAVRESYMRVRLWQEGQRFVVYGGAAEWNDPEFAAMCEWLDGSLAPGGAVASPFPWAVHGLTGRPGSLLPMDLDTSEKLSQYLAAYPPAAVVFDPAARGHDPAQALLRLRGGWKERKVGRFRVFLRPPPVFRSEMAATRYSGAWVGELAGAPPRVTKGSTVASRSFAPPK